VELFSAIDYEELALVKPVETLNEVFSSLSSRRRYEVWFIRFGLAAGEGAWWLRYLMMNPGRNGCSGNPQATPVQVWATWFPREGKPQTFIQGFSLQGLDVSARGQNPFHFRVAKDEIDQNSCRGALTIDGHAISWDLRYRSTFGVTLSNKGWIGFSRTPHSDALFSGWIMLDDRRFEGDPLGYGVQGHNCGYRHRNFWTWAHAYFPAPAGPPSTLEALLYEMPFGLIFRKVVLWHEGKSHVFRNLREIKNDHENLQWSFRCIERNGFRLEAAIDGCEQNIHRLQYQKTDCSGSFPVLNNSLARAAVALVRCDGSEARLETTDGAVLEMSGYR
jgi:hypothetical protein